MKRKRSTPKPKPTKSRKPARKSGVSKIGEAFLNLLPEKFAGAVAEGSAKRVGAAICGIFCFIATNFGLGLVSSGGKESGVASVPAPAPAPVIINLNLWQHGEQLASLQSATWGSTDYGGSATNFNPPSVPKTGSPRAVNDAKGETGSLSNNYSNGSFGGYNYGGDSYVGYGFGGSGYTGGNTGNYYVPSMPKSGSLGIDQGAESFAGLGYDDHNDGRSTGKEDERIEPGAAKVAYTGGEHYSGLASSYYTPSKDAKPMTFSSYTPKYPYYTPSGDEAVKQKL